MQFLFCSRVFSEKIYNMHTMYTSTNGHPIRHVIVCLKVMYYFRIWVKLIDARIECSDASNFVIAHRLTEKHFFFFWRKGKTHFAFSLTSMSSVFSTRSFRSLIYYLNGKKSIQFRKTKLRIRLTMVNITVCHAQQTMEQKKIKKNVRFEFAPAEK